MVDGVTAYCYIACALIGAGALYFSIAELSEFRTYASSFGLAKLLDEERRN